MRSRTRHLLLFLAAPLIALVSPADNGYGQSETAGKAKALKSFHIEGIEQVRTERISWLQVQVLADAGVAETWSVLQDMKAYPEFLRIFTGVTAVDRTEAMTRYRMSVSPPWPMRNFDSLVWVAKLPELRLILWRSDKDDLTSSHGKIALEEVKEGSRVTYEIHSPAKKAFPPWVVRIGLYLVLPRMAQDFYDRIQQQNTATTP